MEEVRKMTGGLSEDLGAHINTEIYRPFAEK